MRRSQLFDSTGVFTPGTFNASSIGLSSLVNIYDGFYLQKSNDVRVADLDGVPIKR
jgi:hypothetical protein